MLIENSLGVFEDADWHPQAAEELRAFLKQYDLLEATRASHRVKSRALYDQVVHWLRGHNYSEVQLDIYSLKDHVPAVIERALCL